MRAGRTRPRRGHRLSATVLVLGLLTSACGVVTDSGNERTIQVVVLWTGAELDQFEQVVEAYETRTGTSVDLVPAGDDIDSFIRARHESGDPPDVAVLPQPALIRDYADRGWLEPLDDDERFGDLSDRYHEFWQDLGRAPDGTFYGAWIALANKSLLWCLPTDDFEPGRIHDCDLLVDRGGNPETWDELTDVARDLGADPDRPAPIALGAADGWPLTDWFENLLAAHDVGAASQETGRNICPRPGEPPEGGADGPVGQTYAGLAEGRPWWSRVSVENALCDLAELWAEPRVFPDPGADRALLTQFDEAVVQVAGSEQAALVLMGDFASTLATDLGTAGDRPVPLSFFHFPSPTGVTPTVVAGDAAVVFEDSSDGVQFVSWLTDVNRWHEPPSERRAGRPDTPLREPFREPLTSLDYTSPVLGAYDTPEEVFCDGPTDDSAGRGTCTVAWFVGRCTDQTLRRTPCLPGGDQAVANAQFDLSDQLPPACRGVLEAALQDFMLEVRQTGVEPDAPVSRVINTMQEAASEDLCRDQA